MDNKIYLAITGEIVAPKKGNKEDGLQQLKLTLHDMNKKYADEMASKFSIVYDGGFQGLFNINENLMDIIDEFERGMVPYEVRFGIGIGTLSSDLFENVYEIEGECVENSRQMIKELTETNLKQKTIKSNIRISSGDQFKQFDELLNIILTLSHTIRKKWTAKQTEIISTYIKMDENQVNTANKLSINKSYVSRALAACNYYTYKDAIDKVSEYINMVCEYLDMTIGEE